MGTAGEPAKNKFYVSPRPKGLRGSSCCRPDGGETKLIPADGGVRGFSSPDLTARVYTYVDLFLEEMAETYLDMAAE